MNKTSKIIIVGSGETANLAHEYFTHDSDYEVVAFSLNKEYITDTSFKNLPVIPLEELEEHYPADKFDAFVAVSASKLNRNRTKVYNVVKNKFSLT